VGAPYRRSCYERVCIRSGDDAGAGETTESKAIEDVAFLHTISPGVLHKQVSTFKTDNKLFVADTSKRGAGTTHNVHRFGFHPLLHTALNFDHQSLVFKSAEAQRNVNRLCALMKIVIHWRSNQRVCLVRHAYIGARFGRMKNVQSMNPVTDHRYRQSYLQFCWITRMLARGDCRHCGPCMDRRVRYPSIPQRRVFMVFADSIYENKFSAAITTTVNGSS